MSVDWWSKLHGLFEESNNLAKEAGIFLELHPELKNENEIYSDSDTWSPYSLFLADIMCLGNAIHHSYFYLDEEDLTDELWEQNYNDYSKDLNESKEEFQKFKGSLIKSSHKQ